MNPMTPNTPNASPALSDSEYLLALLDDTFASVPQVKAHHERMRAIAARVALSPAQAEPLGQAGAWLPIETAPKDGRKLMLSYRNRSDKVRTVLAVWLTDEQAAETDADDVGLEGGWYECIDNWGDFTEVAIREGEPTHWMPLPPAPTQEHK
jgi:hypothetical protein